MRGKEFFLRWVLTATLIAIGAAIAGALGWLRALFGADPTHITYVTLSVFLVATAWCGWLSWRLASGEHPDVIDVELRHSRFASSLCVSIGLIGTAVGFMIMLQNGSAAGDPSEVIRAAFANTSIAVVNTVFGAVCGVLVEVQSHFIDHAIERARLQMDAEAEGLEGGRDERAL